MDTGLLWYDSRKIIDVKEKITSAVKFFISKYGCLPEACYVNPKNLGEEEIEFDYKIIILPSSRVIANHIWLEFPKK